jgi:hypothetical protein
MVAIIGLAIWAVTVLAMPKTHAPIDSNYGLND